MPWFMLPGIFSGLGRQDRSLFYPEILQKPDAADEWQQSQWDFALERMTMPVVAVHDGQTWRAIESDPHYALENGALVGAPDKEPQVGFGISWLEGSVDLRVNVPAVEGPTRHVRNPLRHPIAPELVLEPQGEVRVTLRHHSIAGPRSAFGLIQRTVFERLRSAACASRLCHWIRGICSDR